MTTTIIISDDNETIAAALRKGTIEIVCSIGTGGPRIVKNRTHIDNGLIDQFLSNVHDNLSPMESFLHETPNVK
jgi:hypothetical protein